MATTYLTRTNSGAGSETTSTFSVWFKRLSTTGTQYLLHTSEDANNKLTISFNGSFNVIGTNNSSTVMNLTPTRVFRDVSAWYHLVVAFDTTQATEADRVKLYINGVQETSFSTATYPSQNLNLKLNQSGDRRTVGNAYDNGGSPSNGYFSGLMSHIHWVDGTAYPASTFGETDATTGEWKIKTSPSVTYGTNGFFVLKDGNSVTDQSGNSNNFTVGGGTLTKTEDNPSNVFATLNPLSAYRVSSSNLTNFLKFGNTELNTFGTNSEIGYFQSTIGVSKGKFYWEVQPYDGTAWGFGVSYNKMSWEQTTNAWWDMSSVLAVGFNKMGNGNYGLDGKSGESVDTGIASSGSDILGFALDMDNYALYVHVNGVYMYSGVPTSGASKTGSILGQLATGSGYLNNGDEIFPFIGDLETGNFARIRTNLGNGTFGTTAVSSAGTNASGNGIFEYDVPTGFTALSTKGLNL